MDPEVANAISSAVAMTHPLETAPAPNVIPPRAIFVGRTRQLAQQRLLILATYRSEQAHLPGDDKEKALEKIVGELQRHQGDIIIALEIVRRSEGHVLVDGLLDTEPNQLDAEFRQALYRQTGGHPLFMVELLEDLKESGALMRNHQDEWVVRDELDWRALPVRVEGAIAARIAHLSDQQRWLLTIASVSGERFQAEVVADVAGSAIREVALALSRDLQVQIRHHPKILSMRHLIHHYLGHKHSDKFFLWINPKIVDHQ